MENSNLEASQKASALADFYLNGTNNIRPENFDIITDMFTDAFVTFAVECFVTHAKLSQTVYQYRYSHLGQFGLNTDDGLPKYGVNHADELYLMWNPLYYQDRTLDDSDQQMSDVLLKAWSTFIKSGVPEVDGVDWSPISVANNQYLLLDNSPKMERSQDYEDKMTFWRHLFPC